MNYDDIDIDGFVSWLWNIRSKTFDELYAEYMKWAK